MGTIARLGLDQDREGTIARPLVFEESFLQCGWNPFCSVAEGWILGPVEEQFLRHLSANIAIFDRNCLHYRTEWTKTGKVDLDIPNACPKPRTDTEIYQ